MSSFTQPDEGRTLLENVMHIIHWQEKSYYPIIPGLVLAHTYIHLYTSLVPMIP